jgi:hypothetical protein
MPIKSRAQWRKLAATKPRIFKRWVAHTETPYGRLPARKRR